MNRDAWPMAPLGDIFDIGAGKTMSAAARGDGDKVPFLRTSNVLWDRLDLSTVDEMVTDPSELMTKDLQPGDLLVCEGGEIGRAAIWDGSITPVTFQNHLHRLRPNQRLASEIEPRFYVFFLQSGFTQQGIFEGAGNKTTIPNLSRNRLAGLDVPIPPKTEQRAIVGVLGAVRLALDIHTSMLGATEALKRAVMQELFTRGLRGAEPQDSEIGPIPGGWELRRMDRWAEVISTRMAYSDLERTESSSDQSSVRVLGIKVSDMNRPGNESVISEAALERWIPVDVAERYAAPPGTVVFPKRGAAIATNKKRSTETWTVFDPNVIGVIAGDKLDPQFLYQWLQRFDLRTITEPGPTPQLNKKNVEPLMVAAPTNAGEQQEIVDILGALDAKIDLHRQKKALCEELFQALLHGLMTQEISVDDLDLTVLPEREAVPA
jgi:type I restriction enzyme S subunit